MSKGKFEKAVAIVQSLPKDGPIQPTQEEQLYVRNLFPYVPRPAMVKPPRRIHAHSSIPTISKVQHTSF